MKASELSRLVSSIRMQGVSLSNCVLLADQSYGDEVDEIKLPRILLMSIHRELMAVAQVMEESLDEDPKDNPLLSRGSLLRDRSIDPPEGEGDDG